ncbi:RlpA-like double-psi beta-barrel-protein domain-containing protein-containing protein [Hygrophoropsis aurantiaca]|uniref:RlpA-like double-psi beta-barrel-protein domain-containing protein-containing protein n=1 Tax=Hygrophoropsis aurantiaca TaxID=72124 RepID=A0ACB8AHV4_9AGAM|nr:RlpA-like double-psi beta-barrel-protein domain-containing protein-containing protein [Hygrophoropsis aurantiaca]
MRLLSSLSAVLSVALVLSFTSVSANPHDVKGRWHHAKRQEKGDVSVRAPGDVHLYKRFDGARFTYYADGLGACGGTNQPGDFIVALNSAQFDSGSYCGKSITITVNGKTTGAIIADRCPGCPYGGLDFSDGLFTFFALESVGVLYGSWYFNDQAPPPPPSWQPPPPPSTTWQPAPSTWLPPPPPASSAPAWTPPSSSSSSPSFSSSSSSSSSSVTSLETSTSTSSSVAPAETAGTVTITVADTSNIYDLNLAIVYLAALLTTSELQ